MRDNFAELDKFMKWLEENHPAIHEKHGRNFTISPHDGVGVATNTDYRISSLEFEKIGRIATSYYIGKPIDEFDTVEFNYATGLSKDTTGEAAMLNNVTMWLRPIIQPINKAKGKVVIYFTDHGRNVFWLDHVSDELKATAKGLVAEYEISYGPL
jgi:hypothetical protein